jgi:hypothetical protein
VLEPPKDTVLKEYEKLKDPGPPERDHGKLAMTRQGPFGLRRQARFWRPFKEKLGIHVIEPTQSAVAAVIGHLSD